MAGETINNTEDVDEGYYEELEELEEFEPPIYPANQLDSSTLIEMRLNSKQGLDRIDQFSRFRSTDSIEQSSKFVRNPNNQPVLSKFNIHHF